MNLRDRLGRTALIRAAEQGCPNAVQVLLAAPGVDMNAADSWNKTALDYAWREAIVEMEGRYSRVRDALLTAGAVGTHPLHRRPRDTAERPGHPAPPAVDAGPGVLR